MATILITGASGQLGNEIRVASQNYYGYDFIFTDADTLDITGREKTKEFIADARPGWIINCAAYNAVDKAETEYEKALLVNGTAVRYLTEAIRGSQCKLIHVSSDYVFSGDSSVPYNEIDLPQPLTAYGKTKLEGEKYALQHHASMVIRTSWLYSSFGNNFVKTIIRNASARDILRVVFDQTGTPTYAADLAESILVIIAGVIRNKFAFNTGIYHYSNEGVCSWFDFASEIIHESGFACKIEPILSKEFPAAAKRPWYTVMDKSKIKENYNITIPHWRTSLMRCLNILNQTKQIC